MLKVFQRLVKEERGQGMAEYGLILALVAVVVVAALVVLGPAIRDKINEISGRIDTAGEVSE